MKSLLLAKFTHDSLRWWWWVAAGAGHAYHQTKDFGVMQRLCAVKVVSANNGPLVMDGAASPYTSQPFFEHNVCKQLLHISSFFVQDRQQRGTRTGSRVAECPTTDHRPYTHLRTPSLESKFKCSTRTQLAGTQPADIARLMDNAA